jgi:aryl-alcohol dehydrogenase-like predicted oxidoreductase
MTFGKQADEQTSIAMMNRARDVGINFLDTANVYGKGLTEDIIGRWLRGHREEIVVASKVHFPMGEGPNDWGSSRRHIFLSVENSLRRLKTEWLDILYLHHWDETTDLDQSLGALTALVNQGKVLYCGVSNFSAWQTMKAVALANAKNLAPIVCIQPMYNLVKRRAEVEILPLALSERLAVCPYSPVGGGLLTGKYQRGETGRLQENEMYRDRYKNRHYWEVSSRFVQYAQGRGLAPAALAVAWVASHPAVTAPIIGARSLEQINETLGCLDIQVTPEVRAEIAALSTEPPSATDR